MCRSILEPPTNALRTALELIGKAPQTAEKEIELPISINVITELGLLHNVYSGRVIIQDFQDQKSQRGKDPNFQSNMPRVNDLSQVTEVDIGFDELLAHARKTREAHADTTDPIQLVLVGETKSIAPAVAMYENLYAACNIPFELHVVSGYPEVLAVLNLPADGLKHFPDFCRQESHLL